MNNMFFCTRIDIRHAKSKYFTKDGQIFDLRWLKAKYHKVRPSTTSHVSSLICVELRINWAQFQSQTVTDNTSSRTQQIGIEL